jgi:hypothetical protein
LERIASSAELDLVEWLKRRFCMRSFAVAKGKQNFFDSMFLKKLGE